MKEKLDRITSDPAVMDGQPCIRGLRITVRNIVGMMSTGSSEARILQLYPHLDAEDIRQAVAYATQYNLDFDANATSE